MESRKKNAISRRDFISKLWGIAVAMPFLYSAVKFMIPPQKPFITTLQRSAGNSGTTISLPLDAVLPGGSILVNIESEPVIIIRRSDSEFIALSAVCTHLNCTVGYRSENKDIYCACHGGRYDLNGNVIEGPPKAPLKKFNVILKNNMITVSKES